jgi:peptidoglycan/LPS O-acetylase OafA/YrhL
MWSGVAVPRGDGARTAIDDSSPIPLGYRPALDGLRGIAVLLVIGQHAWVPAMDRAGGVGVTLFFVLSGFLISTLLIEERAKSGQVDLLAFWMRRARRLLPALAVFLFAMALVGFSATVIFSSALYVSNWLFALKGAYDPLVHLWTLAVEEQFYLLWPLAFVLLAWLPGRAMLWVLVVAAVASALARVASTMAGDPYWWTFFATHLRADALLAGCALAYALRRWPWRPTQLVIACAVGAAVIAAMNGDRTFHTTVGLPLAIGSSIVLVAAAVQLSPRALTWRPVVYVGTISYGLYLWHRPLTWWVNDADSGPLAMAVAVVAAFLIAGASYHLWESRLVMRRDHRINPRGTIHTKPRQREPAESGPLTVEGSHSTQ